MSGGNLPGAGVARKGVDLGYDSDGGTEHVKGVDDYWYALE